MLIHVVMGFKFPMLMIDLVISYMDVFDHAISLAYWYIFLIVDGLLMEPPSAQFVNSKYTRMVSTVTHVLTPKVKPLHATLFLVRFFLFDAKFLM